MIPDLFNKEKIDIISNKILDYFRLRTNRNIVINRSLKNILIIFTPLKPLIIEIKGLIIIIFPLPSK